MTEPADRQAGSSVKYHSNWPYGKELKEGVGKRFGTDTEFIMIHDAGWYKTDGRSVHVRTSGGKRVITDENRCVD